ncbi:hypothetical protein ACE1TI_17895 [Alteribacillus sp. JSM 102045]|uniref:hypothetical protein n=1 Tax=Alteribacillus sp. JSM 102045 TaxID=1562101 RepID=UPI0035C006C9
MKIIIVWYKSNTRSGFVVCPVNTLFKVLNLHGTVEIRINIEFFSSIISKGKRGDTIKKIKILASVVFILLVTGYGIYRFYWLPPYLEVEDNVTQYLTEEKDYERKNFELVDRKYTKGGYRGIRIGVEFEDEPSIVYHYMQLGDGTIEQTNVNGEASTVGNYKHIDENGRIVDRNKT